MLSVCVDFDFSKLLPHAMSEENIRSSCNLMKDRCAQFEHVHPAPVELLDAGKEVENCESGK